MQKILSNTLNKGGIEIKKNIIIAILCVITAISIFVAKSNFSKEPTMYKVDLVSGDLVIDNFTLISYGKDLYVPEGFCLKGIGNNIKFNNISINISSKGKSIINLSMGDVVFQDGGLIINTSSMIKDINISDNSVLVVKVNYNLNGVDKKEFNEIKLKDYKQDINK